MKQDQDQFIKSLNLPKRSYYKGYGRCINLSSGLIIGLIIDKILLYLTKGLSVFIPPFAVMLMNQGPILKQIRFERKLPKFIEKILHL